MLGGSCSNCCDPCLLECGRLHLATRLEVDLVGSDWILNCYNGFTWRGFGFAGSAITGTWHVPLVTPSGQPRMKRGFLLLQTYGCTYDYASQGSGAGILFELQCIPQGSTATAALFQIEVKGVGVTSLSADKFDSIGGLCNGLDRGLWRLISLNPPYNTWRQTCANFSLAGLPQIGTSFLPISVPKPDGPGNSFGSCSEHFGNQPIHPSATQEEIGTWKYEITAVRVYFD